LALLAWASKRENWANQTEKKIADACGIPVGTLESILFHHRHHGERTCYLCTTARNYRYTFKVFPGWGSGSLIQAIHMGYTLESYKELEQGDNAEKYK